MKTAIKYLVFGFLFFAMTLVSCSKDGAIGPQGENGINGAEGIDGVDGNANVTNYIFNDPQWGNGTIMRLDMTGILTTDVLTNDVVLVYLLSNSLQTTQRVFQIPGWVHGKFPEYPTQMITPYFTDTEGGAGAFQIPEQIYISTRSVDNTTIPPHEAIPLKWIRVVIIKSTAVVTAKKGTHFSNMSYEEVCAYFNINHE